MYIPTKNIPRRINSILCQYGIRTNTARSQLVIKTIVRKSIWLADIWKWNITRYAMLLRISGVEILEK